MKNLSWGPKLVKGAKKPLLRDRKIAEKLENLVDGGKNDSKGLGHGLYERPRG